MSVAIDPRRHDAVLFDLDVVAPASGQPPEGDGAGFAATAALARRLQRAGVRTAVVSPNRDCRQALAAAGLTGLFAVCVDRRVAEQPGVAGRPDPQMLVEATGRLAVRPDRCVVVDHAADGVAAARRAGFALVIGVDRTEHGDELHHHGADAAVGDLDEVTVRTGDRRMSELPDARQALGRPDGLGFTGQPAVFFDFDGTLSEIVEDPDAAVLTAGAAQALQSLIAQCPVAVLSGRDLADVRERVGLPGVWYAGSHGFELTGPDATHHQNDEATAAIPLLDQAAADLRAQLGAITGVALEHKRFGVSVHYRNAARPRVGEVTAAVRAAGQRAGLRVTTGREVIELRPNIDWDKGKALRWVIDQLTDTAPHAGLGQLLPVYLGDDITDEDAFDAVRPDGIGIVVRHGDDGDRATAARFALDSPQRVAEFTAQLARRLSDNR